jgi:hypothetical protein
MRDTYLLIGVRSTIDTKPIGYITHKKADSFRRSNPIRKQAAAAPGSGKAQRSRQSLALKSLTLDTIYQGMNDSCRLPVAWGGKPTEFLVDELLIALKNGK